MVSEYFKGNWMLSQLPRQQRNWYKCPHLKARDPTEKNEMRGKVSWGFLERCFPVFKNKPPEETVFFFLGHGVQTVKIVLLLLHFYQRENLPPSPPCHLPLLFFLLLLLFFLLSLSTEQQQQNQRRVMSKNTSFWCKEIGSSSLSAVSKRAVSKCARLQKNHWLCLFST